MLLLWFVGLLLMLIIGGFICMQFTVFGWLFHHLFYVVCFLFLLMLGVGLIGVIL